MLKLPRYHNLYCRVSQRSVMSKGFLALHRIIPSMAWSPMPIRPGNSALSRVVCTLLEWGPCSPQLALRVQMHELRMCPMLVLNAYLHF
jgi:hypothetical protein